MSGAPDGVIATREMLERARRNLEEHFVAFGLVERFDHSLLLFARALGWRNLYSLRQNVTRERPARRTLTSSTVAMIEKLNVLDRELYTFASEAFESMLRAHGVHAADVVRFKILNRLHGLVVAASDKARTARAMARDWGRRASLRSP